MWPIVLVVCCLGLYFGWVSVSGRLSWFRFAREWGWLLYPGHLVGEFLRSTTVAFATTVVVICVVYVLARILLVVESFISVRSLPVGSFKTPEWENIRPHL